MVEKAVQGVYFKLCCHQCFKELIAPPRNNFFLKSFVQGNNINKLSELRVDTYWLPRIRNFPDIDAAVMHNNILNALQYTFGQKHSFDFDRSSFQVYYLFFCARCVCRPYVNEKL
jgi:hypothetical protein